MTDHRPSSTEQLAAPAGDAAAGGNQQPLAATDQACAARPREEIEREFMNRNVPHNEGHWWAIDEICRLREASSNWDALKAHISTHMRWGPLQGDEKTRFLVLALCGEVGELANLVKKDWRRDGGDRREEIRAEIADVGNYLFMLAAWLGIDLAQAMLQKLGAVERRRDFLDRGFPSAERSSEANK